MKSFSKTKLFHKVLWVIINPFSVVCIQPIDDDYVCKALWFENPSNWRFAFWFPRFVRLIKKISGTNEGEEK